MKKIYYYPSAGKRGYPNPYSINYKRELEKHFILLDSQNKYSVTNISFIKNAFIADVVVLNWIETIVTYRYSFIQYLLSMFGLFILWTRRKKIIWMFHNIHPHQGENKYSKAIKKYLFKHANLIISHSKAGAEYAKIYALKPEHVIYRCHPVKEFTKKTNYNRVENLDVFIWGAILPYKGIKEFLSYLRESNFNLRVKIIGRCKDPELLNDIKSLCTKDISFENRYADFSLLSAYMSNSKYTLFPYIGNCVSSSGALIDTLVLGGNPVGPNVGAFKDLSQENLCITYLTYDDLLNTLRQNIRIDDYERENFIRENTWSQFGLLLQQEIELL